jgi:2,5-diketo-D-gluconate reductase B
MRIFSQSPFERGFGTYPLKGELLHETIKTALDAGYRAFDTAQMYGNEADVGIALAATKIRRNELCITTKVHPNNYTADRFLPSVERSLIDLKLARVDCLLLHWPPAGGDIAPSLKLLQSALDRGLTRTIGVSNFTVKMMHDAKAIVDAQLATNQVEFHPLLNQDKLLAAAAETGIPLSSYSSVARGEVFKHAVFGDIGKAYGKSAGQVVLRWILQKGVSLNTMSTNPENIRANFDIADFVLSSRDMAQIDKMTHTNHRIVRKGAVPWVPDWD